LWDASPQIGDRVVVIGGGTVGCLVAWLARGIPGTTVQLVDTNERRAGVAAALGVRFSAPDDTMREADLVVHASGSSAGLAQAIDVAGFEATIVEMSWYGTQMVTLPLGGAFHAKRLTIMSSQVGNVARSRRSRADTRRRMALALALLADPALDRLVSGESDFEELPSVMPSLADGPGDTLCHAVRYAP
jgi:threonine dehydrogenase-like Zn-dependent dehydrogenase